MNTPTHLASGACLAYALASSLCGWASPPARVGLVVAGSLAGGLASHLLLDLLPHYAWVVYLDWFRPLPFHWLIREAVFGLAVAVPSLICAGKSRPYVALGMFGGIYPDIEKVLSVDFHVPDRFILFGWHSTCLSTRTAGLPKAVLTGIEGLLVAGFLLALWQMKRTASNKSAFPVHRAVALPQ